MDEPAAGGDAPGEIPPPEPEPTAPFQAHVNKEGFLTFAPPKSETAESAALTADIVDLDHRIHRRLGSGSSDWAEVMGVMTNAANMLMWGRFGEARELFARAEMIWRAHLEERNRLRYLTGVGVGIVPAGAVSVIAVTMLSAFSPRRPPGTGASDAAAAAVAFAVGFSERLAKDVIVRISGDSTTTPGAG